MKKSLLAVAVLGAFAGTAMAADVTLYGLVDTGFTYTHAKYNKTEGQKSKKIDKFEMTSGNQSGSRFGLKGVEDLGNGYKVGFVLETQFTSDNGKEKSDTFFHRQATLDVSGGFGQVYFGRLGAPMNGTGTIAKAGQLSAFGTSWGDYAANVGSTMVTDAVRNNAVAYVSPNFAGFQAIAYYSMGNEGVGTDGKDLGYKGTENKSIDNERYAAIAATYKNGPLSLFANVDRVFYEHDEGMHPNHPDDSLTVTFGGNYDFGVVKVYGGAQYFDDVKASKFGAVKTLYSSYAGKMVKGFGLNLSASAPVFGGTARFGVSYLDGKQAKTKEGVAKYDLNRARVSVGYSYPFSKRTNVYAVAGYGKDELKIKPEGSSTKIKADYGVAMFGLRHSF
jgi:predicted porin